MKHLLRTSVGVLPLLAIAGQAHAHHAMGGELPSTWAQGLLSGLGHPVIGVDHLAFLLAAGVVAGAAGFGAAAPTAFVIASLGGVGLHLALLALPAVEPVIALSVVAAGLALAAGLGGSRAAWILGFAGAGLFHGYAYGESIVGAEPAPLVAYLAGLALVQTGLALAAWRLARARGWRPGAVAPRMVGAAALGVGVSTLAGQLFG
jgi:urease accessory protein